MNLKSIETCKLVEELASRQGIEMIRIPPDGRCEVAAERPYEEGDKEHKHTSGNIFFYDDVKDGPEVVLRIID